MATPASPAYQPVLLGANLIILLAPAVGKAEWQPTGRCILYAVAETLTRRLGRLGSQFAVGDVQVFRRCCELYAVAFGKLALCCAVDGDSLQAARVVGHRLAGFTLDRD